MYSREHKLYLRKKKIRKILVIFTQILLAVLLISIWELLATYKVINTFITSSPSRVLSTIISLYNDNNLFNNIWTTIYETLISFSLGTISVTEVIRHREVTNHWQLVLASVDTWYKKVNYNNNPILKWCLTNTAVKKSGLNNIQPVKISERRRIDGAVSLLNAWVLYVKYYEDFMYSVG